jgi:hypothetical protein
MADHDLERQNILYPSPTLYPSETLYPRGQQELPVAVDIFPKGKAPGSTCQTIQLVTFATQNAVSKGADQWECTKGQPPFFRRGSDMLEYRDKGNENAVITDDASNALWKQVREQTDLQVDLAFAAVSLCIRSEEPDHSAWIYAEKFLESRDLEKSTKPVEGNNNYTRRTAGYRPENYQSVEQAIFSLEKIWLTISQPIETEQYDRKTKKRKRRQFTYKGRFLVVKSALTQKDLGTTPNDTGREIAWKIIPGDWLNPYLESPNRQVANLSERALQYDPYRQKWEKYLSRYFFFNGHMNAKGQGSTFNRHIGRLIEDCSLEIERDRPKRTRERFEKAMDQIQQDGFINAWRYKEPLMLPERKWIDAWLDQMITIDIAPTHDRRMLS